MLQSHGAQTDKADGGADEHESDELELFGPFPIDETEDQ